MIPPVFEYHTPESLEAALTLLGRYHGEARLLAGGHSLLPLMKLRLISPAHLIDIGRLGGLSAIREAKGQVSIGVLATHYGVASSELLQSRCPLICECAAQIGDVQVRNRGTIGGSLAHADPAADYPAAILALEAELEAVSSRGKRSVKAEEFFVDLFTTALAPDEILTTVRVPTLPPRTGTAYLKFPHPASGFAVVGVAAVVSLSSEGKCEKVRLGITGVASKAYRAKEVEAALTGQTPDDQALRQVAQRATVGITPTRDIFASADYRAHLAQVYTIRALHKAVSRNKE